MISVQTMTDNRQQTTDTQTLGSTTTAVQRGPEWWHDSGLPDHVIELAGRWQSDTFTRYVRHGLPRLHLISAALHPPPTGHPHRRQPARIIWRYTQDVTPARQIDLLRLCPVTPTRWTPSASGATSHTSHGLFSRFCVPWGGSTMRAY